jgi:hypothetical protein
MISHPNTQPNRHTSRDRLPAFDLGALTPLIWDHANPYGRFDLDMEIRLPID